MSNEPRELIGPNMYIDDKMKMTKLCREYSDDPDKLQTVLDDLCVEIKNLITEKYFPSDKEERDVLTVVIKRGRNLTGLYTKEIQFKFGCSLHDTQKRWGKPTDAIRPHMGIFYYDSPEMLYSILCSCQAEYYCPSSLEEFLDEAELRYNRESQMQFLMCQEQSEKLHKIFTEEEIECLPA